MRNQLYTLLTLVILFPSVVFAQVIYNKPMVNLPGYDGGGGFDDFINLIYGLAISFAALLAVVKIVIAGVKWMLSDIVTDKSDAKKDIQGALLGLIVIISAVLIIYVINPTIVGG